MWVILRAWTRPSEGEAPVSVKQAARGLPACCLSGSCRGPIPSHQACKAAFAPFPHTMQYVAGALKHRGRGRVALRGGIIGRRGGQRRLSQGQGTAASAGCRDGRQGGGVCQ